MKATSSRSLKDFQKKFRDLDHKLTIEKMTKIVNKEFDKNWSPQQLYNRFHQLKSELNIGHKESRKNGGIRWMIESSALPYIGYAIYLEDTGHTMQEACRKTAEKASAKAKKKEKLSFKEEEPDKSIQGMYTKKENIDNSKSNGKQEEMSRESLYQKIKSLFLSKSSNIKEEKGRKKEKEKSLQESSSALTKAEENINRIPLERTKTLKKDKTLEKKGIIEIDKIREKFDLPLDKELILIPFTDPSINQNHDWMTNNKVYAEFGEETLRETLEIFFFQQDYEARQIKVHLENWGEDRLGRIGRQIGLHNHVLVGENQMAEANSVLSQVIKAIIGVIKFHQSLAEAQKWIENFLLAEVLENG